MRRSTGSSKAICRDVGVVRVVDSPEQHDGAEHSCPPPTPSWGAMLTSGRRYLGLANHLAIFPGAAIMLAVMGLNFLGDGLIDALDPKYRKNM